MGTSPPLSLQATQPPGGKPVQVAHCSWLPPRYPQQSVSFVDELGYVVGVADQADTRAVIAEHHAHPVVAEIVNLDSGCGLAVEWSN